MRPLKFRAWCRHCKEMKNDVLVLTEKGMDFHEGENHFVDWMQFTGLKDKNGKDVYEGDIVEKMISGRKVKTSVLWDDSLTGFTGLKNILDCEIIGNIYESPSLLGKV